MTFLPGTLREEAEPYLSGKATAKFAHSEPLPIPIIARLLRQMADNFHQGLS